jgi:hypothetical protein
MDVDLVVTLESHPTKLEVAFNKNIISSAANISSVAKGFVPVQAPSLVEVKTFSSDMINLTLSNITIKDKLKAPMVGIGMEGEVFILIQPKSVVILATIVLSFSTTLKDVGLNVREEIVDVIKVTTMEE